MTDGLYNYLYTFKASLGKYDTGCSSVECFCPFIIVIFTFLACKLVWVEKSHKQPEKYKD